MYADFKCTVKGKNCLKIGFTVRIIIIHVFFHYDVVIRILHRQSLYRITLIAIS